MKVSFLSTFPEKLIGVSFKDKFETVYFETRWGIHTFFVRKPIDVIICDDNFIVRKVKRALKPWRIFLWNPKYKGVLETPAGDKNFTKIKLGDKLPLKF